jgi:hypothetical protein
LIERFNFYDVYGNFLPGLAFLALIWLPIGITRQVWPGKEITSAIAVLAFAYIVGHVIQTVLENAFPSMGKDANGRRRYPSDYFLDSKDRKFTEQFKRELEAAVRRRFNIDLNASVPIPEGQLDRISTNRKHAFDLVRNTLLQTNAQSYAQQFQGLYALMRGLAGAFWLGSAYMLGWSLSCILAQNLYPVGVLGWIGLGIACFIAFFLVCRAPSSENRTKLDAGTFVALLVALAVLGVQLGSHGPILSRTQLLTFALIFAVCIWCGARCFLAYKKFACEFARATWQDFLSYQRASSNEAQF